MRINKKLFEIKDVKFRQKFSSKISLLLEKDSRVGIIKIGRVDSNLWNRRRMRRRKSAALSAQ